ncbi:O-antigen ligase family protein [Allomeiothermus silvanus]|uniref:O-antigen ligase family protein n=1 Tax=Allomeiothermus silvanus TaxID=52022 RepID=UPI001FDA3211|nr:O-antigen ligase family protein [Allomeiothermus silvanus]
MFALLPLYVGYHVCRTLRCSSGITALQVAAWFLLLVVAAKTIFSWQSIYEYLQNPYAHPELAWLYGGGPNLEATWLVMNAAFFRKSKMFWLYWAFAVVVSTLYASRIGILLALLLAIIQVVSARRFYTVFVLLVVALFSGILLYVINPHSIERFTQIGQEPGSSTRLKMWSGALAVLQQMPIAGYGAGNAIPAIERVTGSEFLEDNVHNYYLQVLLDFGPLGLLSWLWLVFWTMRRSRIFTAKDEIGTYLVLYFLGCFVQFRGAEPLFWFVMGLFLASRGRVNREIKNV